MRYPNPYLENIDWEKVKFEHVAFLVVIVLVIVGGVLLFINSD